jgi:shikimate kinase
MARWETLFAARRPVYERLADIIVDVRSGTVAEIALHVEERLREYAALKEEVQK